MDWRLVLKMAAPAAAFSLLTILGLIPPSWEQMGWLVLAVAWAYIAPRYAADAPFRTVFVASIVAGFFSGDLKAIFLDEYLRNNPGILAVLDGQRPSRMAIVIAETFWRGAILGILAGVVALISVRLRRPKTEATPVSDETTGVVPAAGMAAGAAGAAETAGLAASDSEE